MFLRGFGISCLWDDALELSPDKVPAGNPMGWSFQVHVIPNPDNSKASLVITQLWNYLLIPNTCSSKAQAEPIGIPIVIPEPMGILTFPGKFPWDMPWAIPRGVPM